MTYLQRTAEIRLKVIPIAGFTFRGLLLLHVRPAIPGITK